MALPAQESPGLVVAMAAWTWTGANLFLFLTVVVLIFLAAAVLMWRQECRRGTYRAVSGILARY